MDEKQIKTITHALVAVIKDIERAYVSFLRLQNSIIQMKIGKLK